MALKDGDTIPDALEGVPTSWDAVSAPPATSRDLLLASAQGLAMHEQRRLRQAASGGDKRQSHLLLSRLLLAHNLLSCGPFWNIYACMLPTSACMPH